jgi:hypothetical protein
MDRIFDDLTMPSNPVLLTCARCLHTLQPGQLYRRIVRIGKADRREHMLCPPCTCPQQGA